MTTRVGSTPNLGARPLQPGASGRFLTHWLLWTNLGLVLVLAGAAAAPALHAAGWPFMAQVIHTLYLLLCPQRPEHSYFLFGYQTALEHREIGMLAALLLGGLLYPLVRQRVSPLAFWLLVASCIPIGWDVLSQTLGLRESDWFTRTWTGGLVSLAYVFCLYPRFDRALLPRTAGQTV